MSLNLLLNFLIVIGLPGTTLPLASVVGAVKPSLFGPNVAGSISRPPTTVPSESVTLSVIFSAVFLLRATAIELGLTYL